ncbi:choice-of-anchor I family protein [Antribacter gilvus]|uniref:choice-of-anchor I family protein n=1 Tax=Antribacter gilvus TaxID=2304675 RepID=UPI000F78A84B|nr:choice-of-anchor I family protein [Antribacter gilvus]
MSRSLNLLAVSACAGGLVLGAFALPAATALPAAPAAGGAFIPGAGVVADPVTYSADRAGLALRPLGSYSTGVFDESSAEVVAYHARSERLFSVNAQAGEVTVLDVSDVTAPARLFALQTTGVPAADGSVVPDGAVANSVAVRSDGLTIVAVESPDKVSQGWLVFFDAAGDGAALGAVRVGALPDMVTVTPDGRTAVVANEGEPDDDFTVDPEGTVSVVALAHRVAAPAQSAVRTADFHAFEGDALPEGVRVFGPDVAAPDGSLTYRVSRNLEPEYVAVDKHSGTAYVALQEANAVAEVDLASATVTAIRSLGAKDHSVVGQGIDPSDKDGVAAIREVPVQGLYMPDGLTAYSVRGETYLVSANEGDAREWGDYAEPVRVKSLGKKGVPPVCAGSPAAGLLGDADLGRLNVTTASGLSDDGTCYEELYSFGSRSFSIWTTDGELVFDSGTELEEITSAALGDAFNTNHTETNFEGRSDDKGPEPENLAIGSVGGRTYAFIGLERASGVVVYDISSPAQSELVTYVSNRDYSVSVEDADDTSAALSAAGDLGPEGLAFIPASDSPTHKPLLAVANEVSGTTTLFQVDLVRGRG